MNYMTETDRKPEISIAQYSATIETSFRYGLACAIQFMVLMLSSSSSHLLRHAAAGVRQKDEEQEGLWMYGIE
jgi:hypothetical protein